MAGNSTVVGGVRAFVSEEEGDGPVSLNHVLEITQGS